MPFQTLPKPYTQAIKGFLSLIIVGTHISATLLPTEASPLWLRLSNVLTPIALALFFFFSGFGLMTQLLVKESKMPDASSATLWWGWLPKRLWGLLKPFLFFFVLSLGMEYVSQGLDTFSWAGLGTKLSSVLPRLARGLASYPPTAWFLLELIILYLFFFISLRWLTDKRWGLLLLTGLIGGLILLFYQLDWPTFWRSYPLVFALGAWYAYAEEKAYRLLTRWLPALLLALVSLGLWYIQEVQLMTSLEPRSWTQVTTWMLSTHLLPLAAIILSKRTGITDLFLRHSSGAVGRLLLRLGDISLEVYLLHISFVYLFRGPQIYIDSPWSFMLAVYAATLLGSYALARFFKPLIRA